MSKVTAFDCPPPGRFVLVTDELASPADFVLHRFLSSHVKAKEGAKCVIISAIEDLARWTAIAAKTKTNIRPFESLLFIDIAEERCNGADCDTVLRSVFNRTLAALADWKSHPLLVIVDDLATLEWVGFSSIELQRFSRALAFLCRRNKCSLVVRHHATTRANPDDVLRCLFQLCTYHVEVLPLSSGKSGTVGGEVAVHFHQFGRQGPDQDVPAFSRTATVQFRLTETGAVFFDKGTGGGFL